VVGRIRFALERFDSPRHSSHVVQLFSLGVMATHVTPYAGYTQFGLSSSPKATETDPRDFWSDEAFRDRLAAAPFALSVGTNTYGEVPVDIEVLDAPSQLSFDDWDHIVEASIDISSGILEVSGCPDPEPDATIQVLPGIYEVRVYFRGLSGGRDDGGDYMGDSYLIHLWQGRAISKKVLKRFEDHQHDT